MVVVGTPTGGMVGVISRVVVVVVGTTAGGVVVVIVVGTTTGGMVVGLSSGTTYLQ